MLFDDLVSTCDSVKSYRKLLEFFQDDQIFNHGRKYVLLEYTKAVLLLHPELSEEINYMLNNFLKKNYPSPYKCIIL